MTQSMHELPFIDQTRESATPTRHTSSTSANTEELGKKLANQLAAGDLVLLVGDLAAGKTTFVRGLAAGLNADPEEVSSPSYVLIQEYPCASNGIMTLYHVDLYRLGGRLDEMRSLGLEEPLSDPAGVVAVEWPVDTVTTLQPAGSRRWTVYLSICGDTVREIFVDSPELG